MKHLVTLTDIDIFPERPAEKVSEWEERATVKIIAVNEEGEIALVTNDIHNLYLLPGGGIEAGESLFEAARREFAEEAGYAIKSLSVIGTTEEYRARDRKHYTTYGVLGVAGDFAAGDGRTENEKDLNVSAGWFSADTVHDIFRNQTEKLRNGKIDFYNTGFNIVRDSVFFEKSFPVLKKIQC